jgi:hypothetical protein
MVVSHRCKPLIEENQGWITGVIPLGRLGETGDNSRFVGNPSFIGKGRVARHPPGIRKIGFSGVPRVLGECLGDFAPLRM